MNGEDGNSLFEIKLNEAGVQYIRKLNRLMFVVSILVGLIFLLLESTSVVIVITQYEQLFKEISWRGIANIIDIGISLVFLISNLYFIRFYRTLNRSINQHDQDLFNAAFKYAYRNSILFIAGSMVQLIFSVKFFLTIIS